jgi:hypothetical protein
MHRCSVVGVAVVIIYDEDPHIVLQQQVSRPPLSSAHSTCER